MKKKYISWIALLSLVILVAGLVLVPQSADAKAAYIFYGDYTDVAKIYDYNSCPSIQGVAVGSQKIYSIKINGSDSGAFISMSDKDSGDTVKLYNSDAGSYMFTYLDHANDMDVWGIDGPSNLFVATTKKGAQGIVRLRRDGENLTKVAEYHLKCDGADICATAMSIMSVSNGMINFITKWGMDLYTGSISTSVTNGTLNMTKLCTITKSQAYIKDTYNDLSNYVNQGMGYHKGMLFLPISGDDSNLNRSVILVYNLLNVQSPDELVYPLEHLAFRVTSGAYSALFELESCDICSGDNKLYFGVQRRVTNSDTNHDGVASFDGYTFEVVESQTTHYTVKYDPNGGTGSMADSRVSYGYKMPLRTNTFTRNGWTFAGWAAYRHTQDQWYYTNGTDSGWYKEGSQPSDYTAYSIYSDGVTVAQSTAVDNDTVTMYAQWTPLAATYTIKYDPNGGTGTMADTEVVYGYTTNLRKNTFTRPGYKFVGWTAYRTTKGQWYYTDGTNTGWYVEGSQPAGYTKSVYKDEVGVAKTTSVDGDIVYMYAQWEQSCTHNYASTVTTPATCTTTGVMTYTCGTCGDSYTETIPATDHSYDKVVTAPTCTAEGYTTYTCTNCGDRYTGDTTPKAGHSYTSVVTPPTCTAEGYTTYTCTGCGDQYTGDTTAKADHSYSAKVTAPTCTAEGYTTYTCSVCGYSYKGDTTPKAQHSYDAVVTPPTCTAKGYTTYTCVVCDDSYIDDVTDTIDHDHVNGVCSVCGAVCEHEWVEGKCAICRIAYPVRDYYLFGWIDGANYACEEDYENMGIYKFIDGKLTATFKQDSYVAIKAEGNADWYMAYTYPGDGITACTLFNTKTGSGEKLFVPGGKQITFTLVNNGDDSFTLSYVAKACTHPSHGTDGLCTACGQAVAHSYTAKTTEATCTAPGETVFTCTVCGHSYSQTIPTTGHMYGGWYESKAPTCTEPGELVRGCSTCGATQTQTIAATGHSWKDADCDDPKTCATCGATEGTALGHSYQGVVKAPTCTEAGYTTYTCSVCGHSYTGNAVAAIGHSYDTGKITTDPTCTATGVKTYTCGTCGVTKTETVAMTDHSYESKITAPTCTEAGYTTYTCTGCGHSYTGNAVPASGHSYSGGVCTGCGAADPNAVKDPGLTLNYPTLSFEDEIIYNVYFSVKDTTSIVEMGLMVLPKMDQNATIEDATALVPGYVTNGVAYLAKSEGVPAANMGDTLYFKVYAKLADGSYAYSGAGGYNAKAYANSILNGNNTTEMKALVVSMLNYGAEAQLYFGHNTDKLVNSALTAEQQALVKAYDTTMMDAIVKADSTKTGNFVRVNSNFKSLYPSVSFDGAFAINFYCTPAIDVDDGMTLYYWDMETMASVEKLSIDNATGSMDMTVAGGIWWGQVAGIAAKEMDKTYYVTCVFESDGETITTGIIPYSLGKYCSDKAAADGDAQQSFAQATAVYGYYAKAYFASIA